MTMDEQTAINTIAKTGKSKFDDYETRSEVTDVFFYWMWKWTFLMDIYPP